MISSAEKTPCRHSLREETVKILQKRLQQLDQLTEEIDQERSEILQVLTQEEVDKMYVVSPEDTIESLHFSKEIVLLIGKKGLGIRRVCQLTSYSLDSLEGHIASFIDRSDNFSAVDSASARDIVIQIEECLKRRGHTLSS